MIKRYGKIIKDAGLNIWPHEQFMAERLAMAGHTVEFLIPNSITYQTTADILLDGEKWEMKSPRSSKIKAIERNLKLGSWQSNKLIITSKRMKELPDSAVERELRKQLQELPSIVAIKFINRHGSVVDIN